MFNVSNRDERDLTKDSLNQTRIANGLEAHYHPLVRNEVWCGLALLISIALLALATT